LIISPEISVNNRSGLGVSIPEGEGILSVDQRSKGSSESGNGDIDKGRRVGRIIDVENIRVPFNTIAWGN